VPAPEGAFWYQLVGYPGALDFGVLAATMANGTRVFVALNYGQVRSFSAASHGVCCFNSKRTENALHWQFCRRPLLGIRSKQGLPQEPQCAMQPSIFRRKACEHTYGTTKQPQTNVSSSNCGHKTSKLTFENFLRNSRLRPNAPDKMN
jgi:hypothetical protein